LPPGFGVPLTGADGLVGVTDPLGGVVVVGTVFFVVVVVVVVDVVVVLLLVGVDFCVRVGVEMVVSVVGSLTLDGGASLLVVWLLLIGEVGDRSSCLPGRAAIR
jgi:hypothetical protein